MNGVLLFCRWILHCCYTGGILRDHGQHCEHQYSAIDVRNAGTHGEGEHRGSVGIVGCGAQLYEECKPVYKRKFETYPSVQPVAYLTDCNIFIDMNVATHLNLTGNHLRRYLLRYLHKFLYEIPSHLSEQTNYWQNGPRIETVCISVSVYIHVTSKTLPRVPAVHSSRPSTSKARDDNAVCKMGPVCSDPGC